MGVLENLFNKGPIINLDNPEEIERYKIKSEINFILKGYKNKKSSIIDKIIEKGNINILKDIVKFYNINCKLKLEYTVNSLIKKYSDFGILLFSGNSKNYELFKGIYSIEGKEDFEDFISNCDLVYLIGKLNYENLKNFTILGKLTNKIEFETLLINNSIDSLIELIEPEINDD